MAVYNVANDAQLATALGTALANDTIILAPGTYSGDYNITVSNLTIQGFNAGVEGNDSSRGFAGTESLLTGAVSIDASTTGVTLNGLEIAGDHLIGGHNAGLKVDGDNATVEYTLFNNGTGHEGLDISVTAQGVSVHDNSFAGYANEIYADITATGSVDSNSFYLAHTNLGVSSLSTGVILSNNDFHCLTPADTSKAIYLQPSASADLDPVVLYPDNHFIGFTPGAQVTWIDDVGAGAIQVGGTQYSDYIELTNVATTSAIIHGYGGGDDLAGTAGNDTIDGGMGNDYLDGFAGVNTLSYLDTDGTLGGVTVDLSNHGAQDTIGAGVDTQLNFENLTGSAYNDILTGDGGDNVIRGNFGDDLINAGAGKDVVHGGGGNDEIHAQAGNDIAYGGTGDDTMWGGAGSDVLDGGNEITAGDSTADVGNDTLNGSTPGVLGTSGTDDTAGYLSAGAGVQVNLALTVAQDTGHAGWDTLVNINNLIGSTFDDVLNGNSGNNVLSGGQGNDELHGGQGDDTLYGGIGNDTIYGGAGADNIIGGAGDDVLYGGNAIGTASDGDNFYFGDASGAGSFGHDVIEDFNPATDQIYFDAGVGAISHADMMVGGVLSCVLSDYLGTDDSVVVVGLTWADISTAVTTGVATLVDAHLDAAETGYMVA